MKRRASYERRPAASVGAAATITGHRLMPSLAVALDERQRLASAATRLSASGLVARAVVVK